MGAMEHFLGAFLVLDYALLLAFFVLEVAILGAI